MEKKSYWEINSQILAARYPGLLDQITRNDDGLSPEDIKIETSASGDPVLMIKGLYVHSKRDPAKEGVRLAQSAAEKGTSSCVLIVLGFGLGYGAGALAELETQSPLIIVEKYPALLRLAFELLNMEKLLSRNNVAFVLDENGIGRALSHFERSAGEKLRTEIIRSKPLTDIDGQWYSAVENRIRAREMKDDVNTATLQKFGKRWVRNILRNAGAIRDMPGISRLAGLALNDKGEPLPVFMAAAGPGLDKVSSLLPEIRRRCVIVAVDTSLRFFSRNGVEPDFALVIDPQFWNSRHLDRCVGGNTRLIIESAVYPVVPRLACKGMYLCGSLFPLGKFIEQRVDPKGALAAGGSVATSAWDFSRLLGARQIWIAGLDLAFPGNKTHYSGAQFEEKALAESFRLRPAEAWLAGAMRGGIPCTGAAPGGGQVPTDRRLSLYASWFENCFSQYPGVRNFSLSHGGLAIAGLETAGTDTFLDLPVRRKEIDARLEAVCSAIEADFFETEEAAHRSQRYENAVAGLRSALERIKTACEKGEAIAGSALRASDASRQNPDPEARKKTLAALDTINSLISSSEVKEIAGFLFPSQAPEETGHGGLSGGTDALSGGTDTFLDYMASSVTLYRSLAEAAKAVAW